LSILAGNLCYLASEVIAKRCLSECSVVPPSASG
jgi:hypothetical protein